MSGSIFPSSVTILNVLPCSVSVRDSRIRNAFKNQFVVLLVVGASTKVSAEPIVDKLRSDFGINVVLVPGMDASGFGFVSEPKFMITDKLNVGFRGSLSFSKGGSIRSAENVQIRTGLGINIALLPKFEYYFTTSTIRPFVGFGLGLFNQKNGQTILGNDAMPPDSNVNRLGVAPQIGMDFGKVLLVGTYNKMFGQDIELRPNSVGEVESISQDFISVGILYRPSWGGK